jgi:S-disulfanyl-L-cysteine oxidoreductase SoxD
MSTRKLFAGGALLALALGAGGAWAESPGLGKPISEADIKAWDITILPDGTNLPKGINGTVAAGAKLYEDKGCIACHGPGGSGGANVPMFNPAKIDRIEAPKSIGNFWAQATTVFDMIRRAMPWTQPRTLSDQEVYDLTAYVLFLNKLIDEKDVINAETLPKVKMPNSGNFITRFPEHI